ncbi:SPOR domain-containing protein [Deinococcus multiflagellatus]|uniref:SPOR domain-containing protein n=1 Tax=Deinococcus multiflagellatus TaxID=1656887 RepID=UPI001CCCCEB6|nr:SPOR domain-containing protein [Deinococcus multiflagellatus]MBZ9712145.1 SPOR domain-containing protein [Deinococcus multiflagellatus]
MSRPAQRPAARARRWPDVMIGALVLALLGGFGTVLLRGGNQTTRTPAAAVPESTAAIPSAPGSAPATEAANSSSAATSPAQTTPAPAPADPAATEAPVIAAAPIGAPDPALQAAAAQAAGTETGEAATESTAGDPTAEAAPATEQAPAAAPRTGGAVAASEQRVPLRSDYRISLGTFASEASARSAAAGVQALGYTVYPIDLGSQVVAQLGPFADEASARQALADVQRAYPSAVLYPPRGRSLTGGAAETTQPSAAAPSTAQPAAAETGETAASPSAAAPPAEPAPAPDGPTYLQVGAFDRVESAQNLVQQLRDLGYAPTVNAPEGRKVTVLVGPYTGDALQRTEGRLSANGLDHFRVR